MDPNIKEKPRESIEMTKKASIGRKKRSALREFYKLGEKTEEKENILIEKDGNIEDKDENKDKDKDYLDEIINKEKLTSNEIQNVAIKYLSKHDARSLFLRENRLISEISGLDSERKTLIYDNYNRLIEASEAIKQMKNNVDPLIPIAKSLESSIEQISILSGKANDSMSMFGFFEKNLQNRLNEIALFEWLNSIDIKLKNIKENDSNAIERVKSVREILRKFPEREYIRDLINNCDRILQNNNNKSTNTKVES